MAADLRQTMGLPTSRDVVCVVPKVTSGPFLAPPPSQTLET